jgi:hypothetical protein
VLAKPIPDVAGTAGDAVWLRSRELFYSTFLSRSERETKGYGLWVILDGYCW